MGYCWGYVSEIIFKQIALNWWIDKKKTDRPSTIQMDHKEASSKE